MKRYRAILHKFRIPLALLIMLLCAAISMLLAAGTGGGAAKTYLIRARQYAYDPPVITVNRGDTLHIKLRTMDVVHGFFLEGYGINVKIYPSPPLMRLQDPGESGKCTPIDEILFVAIKTGKFRYRCSHTCGPLHPFMQGELIVEPNYPYHAAIGAAFGLVLAVFFVFSFKKVDDGSYQHG